MSDGYDPQRQATVEAALADGGWAAICRSMEDPFQMRLAYRLIPTRMLGGPPDDADPENRHDEKLVFVAPDYQAMARAMDEAMVHLSDKIHHELFERLAAFEGDAAVSPEGLEAELGHAPGYIMTNARTYAAICKARVGGPDHGPSCTRGQIVMLLGRKLEVTRLVDDGDVITLPPASDAGWFRFDASVSVGAAINGDDQVGLRFAVDWAMGGPEGARRLMVKGQSH